MPLFMFTILATSYKQNYEILIKTMKNKTPWLTVRLSHHNEIANGKPFL